MAHLLALVVLWGLPATWTIKSGLSAVIVLSMVFSLRHAMRPLIIALRVNISGELSIQQRDGDWQEVTLLGTSFVAPYLTILNLRVGGKRWPKHVVLTADALAQDEFRRLRVWLKWGR
jgi:toxin CptA